MTRRLADRVGGFGGLVLLAQLDSEGRRSGGEGRADAGNVGFERGAIRTWLDVATRTRIAIGCRIGGEMLDLFQQRLERIRVRNLLHHVIEQMLDVCVHPSDVRIALMIFSAACSQ